MPLERHIDDLTASDGIKFWMSHGERPVLCRVTTRPAAAEPSLQGPTSRRKNKTGSEHCAPGLIASFSSTLPLAVQYQFAVPREL